MVRRALAWSFLAQILVFAIMFGGSVVVARLLSPREMGIYAVSVATIGILQIIAAFGVGNYIVREVDLDQRTMDTAFTVNALLALFLCFGTFGLSFLGAQFLSEPGVATVLRLLAFSPIISIFEFRPLAMLQREIQFKKISIIATVQAATTTTVTISAALSGASYLSPAYGGLASALVGALGYTAMAPQHASIRTAMIGWKPMALFGIRMMSIGGVSSMCARLSDIIVGHFLGLQALGLYSRASNLSNLIFQNIYGTATRVIFSKMSEDYRATGELRDTYFSGLRFLTAFMGPLLIGLAILSKPIVLLLYGEKWLGAAIPLTLLMIAQFVTLRNAMNWELFVIKDELRIQTRLEFIMAFVGLASRTIGSLFSIIAVAFASVFSGIFATLLYGRQIDRLISTGSKDRLNVTLETALLTGTATLPALILMIWSNWDARTSLTYVVAAIVIGVAAWLAVLSWTSHPLFAEITRTLHIGRAMLIGLRKRNVDSASNSHLGD